MNEALNRINAQNQVKRREFVKKQSEKEDEVPNKQTPLTVEDLDTVFDESFHEEKPAMENQEPTATKVFSTMTEFSNWYLANKDRFSAEQNQALMTIPQAVEAAHSGCPCGEEEKKAMARNYFEHFLQMNANTDLFQVVKKIANANVVEFYIEGRLVLSA